MYQVYVTKTEKQEISVPLGVLKNEFNWKIFLWKQYFVSLQCDLLSMHVASKEKSNAFYVYPNPSHLIYSIRLGFSFL